MSYTFAVDRPNVDPNLWHPLVQQRWVQLRDPLAAALNTTVVINEGYRPDARQAYLFGQGRTSAQLKAKGLDPSLARPGAIVTNAWSAKTSAHGFVLPQCTVDWPDGIPASCALDLDILDAEGKPWQEDAPWDQYVALTTDNGILAHFGLVHFHRPGIAVWDRPHLQLIEWSDVTHNLVV